MSDNSAMATAGSLPDLDPTVHALVDGLWWPLERLAEGLEELARHAGLDPASADTLAMHPSVVQSGGRDINRWMEWAADRLGIEAEPVEASMHELPGLLQTGGPIVVALEHDHRPGFLLLLASKWGKARLIGPDLEVHATPVEPLRLAMCWWREARLTPEIERVLVASNVPADRRPAVLAAMLSQRLAGERVAGFWVLRVPASAGFWRQLRHARLPHRIFGMLAIFAILYGLEITGWTLIGDAALGGRLDMGWLAAWLLLMLSVVPLRMLGGWLNFSFSLDTARILKARLLAGALRMDLETVRRQGVGHLLGRVMESQTLESLALSGGLGVLVAILELGFAAWVLSLGASPTIHLLLLTALACVTGGLAWRYYRRLAAWTMMRLDLTHALIERMVGHRTRLAQESPQRRDQEEDQAMKAYLASSKAMDLASVPVAAGVPHGWMLLAIAGLTPAFVAGNSTPGALAISLGGMFLAQRALGAIGGGLAGLARAAIAWGQVAELFHAAHQSSATQPFVPSQLMAGGAGAEAGPAKLIDAHGLTFRYSAGGSQVLKGVDLTIRRGERILLEGASGGGKSTLASMLAGLRAPDSGLLLLNGLDHHTLGDNWHRLATEAPQFHENHVLSGTMGFNLLMGRDWPAAEADLEEAQALCESLGLGDLLRRMPAGIMQQVGETGWQLSHGERSRLFLARALLQKAQLTILDESFAALDPETLDKCLRCALEQDTSLVVIAHP